jgi:hypothetical protein
VTGADAALAIGLINGHQESENPAMIKFQLRRMEALVNHLAAALRRPATPTPRQLQTAQHVLDLLQEQVEAIRTEPGARAVEKARAIVPGWNAWNVCSPPAEEFNGTISWRRARRKSCPMASSTGTVCCLVRVWNKRAPSKKKSAWQDCPDLARRRTQHRILQRAKMATNKEATIKWAKALGAIATTNLAAMATLPRSLCYERRSKSLPVSEPSVAAAQVVEMVG